VALGVVIAWKSDSYQRRYSKMAQMLGDTLKLVRDKLDSSRSKRDIAYDVTLTLHGLENYPTVGLLYVKVLRMHAHYSHNALCSTAYSHTNCLRCV
jgi:hypothetical protein